MSLRALAIVSISCDESVLEVLKRSGNMLGTATHSGGGHEYQDDRTGLKDLSDLK